MAPIYLDHASTTPVDPRVLKAMLPYFTKIYANPSSIHEAGLQAREAVEQARKKIATLLHCLPEEIIFTSGGTESINLAIKGIAFQKEKNILKGKAPLIGRGHIITSQIEHPAVLETCRYLHTKGFHVTYLPVDKWGLVSAADVKKALRDDTILISLMYANNEIGTLEPIAEIGRLAQQYKIPFHTDACQAGMLDLNVDKLQVDLMTLNGSKIYGPKGIGILYKRKTISLEPLHHGGNQESAIRSGTENVPSIIGFAAALEDIQKERSSKNKKLQHLRDFLIAEILTAIPDSFLNGHLSKRLPSNANFSFAGIEGEALVRYLSQKKIYVSTGSACSSQEIEVSHVLKAINSPHPLGAVRFSLGKQTTKKEIQQVVKILQEIISDLRKIEQR